MDKKCFKCGETKPRSEFYAHRMMGDGLLGKCKRCTKADVRGNREKRVEYYRAYDRLRFYENGHRAPASQEAVKRARSAWKERNRVKRSAHGKVKRAVRAGRIIKPLLCETCKNQRPLQGHHDDYSKPLEVRWLCTPCHGAWHRQYDEAETRAIVEKKRGTAK